MTDRYLFGEVEKCPSCNGRGYTGSENHPECPLCEGNGYIKKDDAEEECTFRKNNTTK